MLYQDDVARMSTSVSEAQTGNNKVELIMKEKQLKLNLDKTVFILACRSSQFKIIREEFDKTPLTINGSKMKEAVYEKYLGDIIHAEGNDKSIEKTINNRYWRIFSATLEVKSILNDCRVNTKGGIA